MTNALIERLRHHVTGAIERGEALPIVEQRNERDLILNALQVFIRQKPAMEPGNYDFKGYNSERRQVHRDLQHAEKLLAAVRMRQGIGADQLKDAFKRAFSGRLSWLPESNQELPDGTKLSGKLAGSLDYCTGQYFATEYRKAVCAVLASALWDYWRDGLPETNAMTTECKKLYGPEKLTAGAYIRKSAKNEFGLTIAKRYFDYRAGDYR